MTLQTFWTNVQKLLQDAFPWSKQGSVVGDHLEVPLDHNVKVSLTLQGSTLYGEVQLVGLSSDSFGESTSEELDPNEWTDVQGWVGVVVGQYAELRNNRLLLTSNRFHSKQVKFLKPHEGKYSLDGGTWDTVSSSTMRSLVFGDPVLPPKAIPPASPVFQNGVREMTFKNPAQSRTKLASGPQPIDPADP